LLLLTGGGGGSSHVFTWCSRPVTDTSLRFSAPSVAQLVVSSQLGGGTVKVKQCNLAWCHCQSYINFLSKLKTHYFNIAFYNHIIC